MTVLIAGCGDVGTEAGLRFVAGGHRVVGWRRSAEKLPTAIEPVVADLTKELPSVPTDTSIVIVAPAAGARSEENYRQVYVEGLANVLDALERDKVRPEHIILVSSTAVYPNIDGVWMDENSPLDPPTATAAVLALLPDDLHQRVLLRCSTNLTNLHNDPVFVLPASAFVIFSAWGLYQIPFLIWVFGAAQRWVGRLPTVGVAVLGHVGSTLIVAGLLTHVVPDGEMARSAQHAVDVGVSYLWVCLAAFVVRRVPRPLRLAYVLGLVAYFAGPALREPTFTGEVKRTLSRP